MKNNIITHILLILVILLGVLVVKQELALRKIKCDLVDSIITEREYTYPILKQIDDPNNYGKDLKNPITSEWFYNKNCL